MHAELNKTGLVVVVVFGGLHYWNVGSNLLGQGWRGGVALASCTISNWWWLGFSRLKRTVF